MTFRSSILASVRPQDTTRHYFKNINGVRDDRSSLTKLFHNEKPAPGTHFATLNFGGP